ncbi:MAG: PepSY domain-containing protein [Salinisphaera sp.]|uniref:PepSY domain-containing protein n=1 Tax=Salinisphaera sp. TaxID=1914330 RepID=UPI003C7DE05E
MLPAPLHRRELLCVLMCVLLMLAYSANAAAVAPGGHSIPPQIGASMLRHADAHAGSGHDRNPQGEDNRHPQQRQDAAQQSPAITPEQAAQRARDRFGGRVLNVILEHGPGGPYYRVKLLEHGRVRVVDIDARR